MKYSVIEGFTVSAPPGSETLDPKGLDRHLDEVLGALNILGAVDADVVAALATGAVEISMWVEADTLEDAHAKALTLIMRAVEEAGGNPPLKQRSMTVELSA
jgi:hypothetical protein